MTHQLFRNWRSFNYGSHQEIKFDGSFCDKHPTEEIKFFCRDCEIPFCTTCFIAKHNKHECCEIGEIVEEFKKDFKQYSDDVSEQLAIVDQQSNEVDRQFAAFSICIDTAEKKILERGEAIKRMVDMHTQALTADLNSHKTHFLKNHLTTKEELQRNMMMCESFVSYCQKAIEEADAVESIRMADELRTRAEELKKGRITQLVKLPDIQFLPLDVAINLSNSFGNISGKYLMLFTHSCPLTRLLPQNLQQILTRISHVFYKWSFKATCDFLTSQTRAHFRCFTCEIFTREFSRVIDVKLLHKKCQM